MESTHVDSKIRCHCNRQHTGVIQLPTFSRNKPNHLPVSQVCNEPHPCVGGCRLGGFLLSVREREPGVFTSFMDFNVYF